MFGNSNFEVMDELYDSLNKMKDQFDESQEQTMKGINEDKTFITSNESQQ